MPDVRCLILTAYDDDDALRAAVIAGASGYVLKDIRGGKLIESVRLAAAGKNLIDPAIARRVVSQLKGATATDPLLDGPEPA